MRAFVLAAGQGTRLRPVTDRLPKPMVVVSGKPILEHLVEELALAGVTDVIINLHHRPDVIERHFDDGGRWRVRITYSREERLLGTAGALWPMAHRLTETFLVVYGDNLHRCPYPELLDFHRAHGGAGTIVVHERVDASQSGVVDRADDGRIRAFVEKPGAGTASGRLVNAGVYVLEPRVLAYIPSDRPCDFGREVFPRMLAQDERMYAFTLRSGLIWVDTVEDYARAAETTASAAGERP